MAHVHPVCLKTWLQSKHTMSCELCHYQIQSRMRLRSLSKILPDLSKAILKKLKKDKLFVLKLILYSAYIFLSAKKAVKCFKLLFLQLRTKNSSLSIKILSILYLVFIFA